MSNSPAIRKGTNALTKTVLVELVSVFYNIFLMEKKRQHIFIPLTLFRDFLIVRPRKCQNKFI